MASSSASLACCWLRRATSRRRRRLVELLDRGEVARRELPGAVVGLLGQPRAGLGRRQRRPARGDHLGARADLDALEIGQRDGARGLGLLEPGQQLGIVDRHQDLSGGDVLAAVDRPLGHPPVDARRDVDRAWRRPRPGPAAAAAAPGTRATGTTIAAIDSAHDDGGGAGRGRWRRVIIVAFRLVHLPSPQKRVRSDCSTVLHEASP